MANFPGPRQGALILLDIDNFKRINDQFGHLEGDKALKYITALLQSTFRSQDIVGRLGGDEFMVFITGPVQKDTLSKRMENLLSALHSGYQKPLTCSAGIVLIGEGESFSYQSYIAQADKALYKSKQKGKNYYCYA